MPLTMLMSRPGRFGLPRRVARSLLSGWLPIALLPSALALASGAEAKAASAESGKLVLEAKAAELGPQLMASSSELAIHVEAEEAGADVRGDVYAVVEHPFAALRSALGQAGEWCELVPLHLNIKSCTHRFQSGEEWVRLYSGRKHYESPEAAHPIDWVFRVPASRSDYLEVELVARSGPLDTRDYVMRVEAVPLEAGRSFVRLHYGYRSGPVARLTVSGYLATVGREKRGFSVVDTKRGGEPVYSDGMRGLIERNAVRYQLAIQAYLDTRSAAAGDRFERRIERWFELTERHPEQLRELERDAYLEAKRRERRNQQRLQRQLDQPVRRASIRPAR